MAKKAAKKTTVTKAISDYMAKMGRKGGSMTGPTKARDPEKMREAQKRRWPKKDKPEESSD